MIKQGTKKPFEKMNMYLPIDRGYLTHKKVSSHNKIVKGYVIYIPNLKSKNNGKFKKQCD